MASMILLSVINILAMVQNFIGWKEQLLNSWKGMNGWWGFDVLVNMAQPYWQPSARETFQKLDYICSSAGLRLKIFRLDINSPFYWLHKNVHFIWSESRKIASDGVAYAPGCSFGQKKTRTWIVEVNPASPINPQLGSHWVCHRPRHHVQHLEFEHCWFRPLLMPKVKKADKC